MPQADPQRPGDLERACPSPTSRSFSKARPEKSCVACPSWTPANKRLTPHQSCFPLAGDIRHLKVAITGHGDMSTAQSKAKLSKSQGNKHLPISDRPITDLPGATEKYLHPPCNHTEVLFPKGSSFKIHISISDNAIRYHHLRCNKAELQIELDDCGLQVVSWHRTFLSSQPSKLCH